MSWAGGGLTLLIFYNLRLANGKKRIYIFVHFFFYILPLFPYLHTLNNSDFRLLDFVFNYVKVFSGVSSLYSVSLISSKMFKH